MGEVIYHNISRRRFIIQTRKCHRKVNCCINIQKSMGLQFLQFLSSFEQNSFSTEEHILYPQMQLVKVRLCSCQPKLSNYGGTYAVQPLKALTVNFSNVLFCVYFFKKPELCSPFQMPSQMSVRVPVSTTVSCQLLLPYKMLLQSCPLHSFLAYYHHEYKAL